ncbi:MAG: hypothetical protein C5B57_10540 [Blastocatellia bacterium]|nr:MAG: hypothetical protein C5B57_10540 [Blastocatellia bacterium]
MTTKRRFDSCAPAPRRLTPSGFVRHGFANTCRPSIYVRAWRTELRLSQRLFAQRVGAAGKAVIYQWESRKRAPSPVLWARVLTLVRARPPATQATVRGGAALLPPAPERMCRTRPEEPMTPTLALARAADTTNAIPHDDRNIEMFEDLTHAYVADHELHGYRSITCLKPRIAHLRSSFGNYRVREITNDAIRRYQTYRRSQNASVASVNRETTGLSRMFKIAVERGAIDTMPSFSGGYVKARRAKGSSSTPSLSKCARICRPRFALSWISRTTPAGAAMKFCT